MANNPKFIGLRELALQLGLSYSWIKKHADDGVIPHVTDGGRVRFPVPEAIDAATKAAESSGATS